MHKTMIDMDKGLADLRANVKTLGENQAKMGVFAYVVKTFAENGMRALAGWNRSYEIAKAFNDAYDARHSGRVIA